MHPKDENGAMGVVRPDQYVSNVLALEAHDELAGPSSETHAPPGLLRLLPGSPNLHPPIRLQTRNQVTALLRLALTLAFGLGDLQLRLATSFGLDHVGRHALAHHLVTHGIRPRQGQAL